MLVALSGQIIGIANPSVWRFEGIIQRFEVIAIGTNVCGTWDIIKEHCSLIALSSLVYSTVICDDGFMRGWNGAFILQNCLFACWQALYCWSVMATGFVSSYVTPMYLQLILYWVNRLLCETGKLKPSSIWSCCALFCMGTSVRSRNCPSGISTIRNR